MVKNIGISGTRHGMNAKQKDKLASLLMKYKDDGAKNFRHGDCEGVDVEAVEIAEKLGYWIIKHPGPFGVGSKADETWPPLPFLVRNKVIVDASDIVLIVPHTNGEVLRSGTWSTYRYAKKKSIRYVIVER